MAMLSRLPRLASSLPRSSRSLASLSPRAPSNSDIRVRIVEVGARDGLQNESRSIPEEVKVELLERLQDAGLRTVEVGSFVSPKWVPQMAGSDRVLKALKHREGDGAVRQILVPNQRGLDQLLKFIEDNPSAPKPEMSIFTAPSESFTKTNINSTVAQSLELFSRLAEHALARGVKVRGYVSVAVHCPFEGLVDPRKTRDVSKALLDMGCYEVSVCDTVGSVTPGLWADMLECTMGQVPVEKLAVHCHDTFSLGLANVLLSLQAGIRTVDSSVAGLGGCPYSPGATGNLATEDVVYALHELGYSTGVDLSSLARTGEWISRVLERPNASRAGRAWLARAERMERLERERRGEGKKAKL